MESRSFNSLATIVLTTVLASSPGATVHGTQAAPSQPSAQTRRPDAAQRAASRVRALQREAERLATEESALLVELRKLEVERQLKTEQITQIEEERRQAERRAADTATRADGLRRAADIERPEIERRLVRVYKLGQTGFWRLLLDVDDLRSVGRAYRTAAALTKIDKDRVLQHQQTLAALARERQELEQRLARISGLETEARNARAALDKAVSARAALVASIDTRRDLNAQLTGELQAAQQRLQASVEQMPGSAAVTLPLRAFQGALPWPAQGRIAVRFGRQSPNVGTAAVVRNGIEISVPERQVVRSVHEGTVAFADQFTGYGNLVIVEHGERTYSLYGFLTELQVSKGDHVEVEAPVGTSGSNPSGKPAVYFELRVDGKPVDPLQWLARN
jgi:septal ring factor EnvC (AmiA/AmiB activator)